MVIHVVVNEAAVANYDVVTLAGIDRVAVDSAEDPVLAVVRFNPVIAADTGIDRVQ